MAKDKILKVTCSTYRDRKALWGQYRKMKEASLKEGTTEVESKAIQVKYEERLGLTEFNNRPVKDPKKAMYAVQEWYPKGCKPTKEQFMEKFWNTVSEEDKN